MTAALRREAVPDAHVWWRIAVPSWSDPLDPDHARRRGGRWNPPGSFRVLYLNEDLRTARQNLRAFTARWPYEPEDLRDDTAPLLIGCTLPRRQIVCDAHSAAGLRAAGLPAAYPLDENGAPVPARALPAGRNARQGPRDCAASAPARRSPGTAPAASWRGFRPAGAASPGGFERCRSRGGSGVTEWPEFRRSDPTGRRLRRRCPTSVRLPGDRGSRTRFRPAPRPGAR